MRFLQLVKPHAFKYSLIVSQCNSLLPLLRWMFFNGSGFFGSILVTSNFVIKLPPVIYSIVFYDVDIIDTLKRLLCSVTIRVVKQLGNVCKIVELSSKHKTMFNDLLMIWKFYNYILWQLKLLRSIRLEKLCFGSILMKVIYSINP